MWPVSSNITSHLKQLVSFLFLRSVDTSYLDKFGVNFSTSLKGKVQQQKGHYIVYLQNNSSAIYLFIYLMNAVEGKNLFTQFYETLSEKWVNFLELFFPALLVFSRFSAKLLHVATFKVILFCEKDYSILPLITMQMLLILRHFISP